MKQKKLQERGITLIALVITIILLLILAGVTLKIVLDNNFVDKAEKSVEKYSEAQKNETEQIKYFLENYLGEVDNTEGTEHRTLNGADPAYNNPIIPVGFKTSSDGASWSSIDGKTVQGWNDGLVIEDKEGNQFVWVPVDGTNVKYEKWLGEKNSSNITSIDKLSEDTLLDGVDETTQITKYGGFYIGRYEAGISESMTEAINTANADKRNVSGEGIKPVVKKNQVPWNFIDHNNAKANAESMYIGEKVKSGLLTGTMWDTVMLWLQNSGVNVDTDCKEWGNYKNAGVTEITKYTTDYGQKWETKTSPVTKETSTSWLLPTGHTNYTKRKNIYDLAGNLWEFTNEKSLNYYIGRGGYCGNEANARPSAFRVSSSGTEINDSGFRVALYIQ